MSGHSVAADTPTRRILGALVIWNVIDIAIHVAVDEVELLRVSSNVVLIVAAATVLLGRAGAHPADPLALAGVVYLALNIAFVIGNGPAVPMTVFIVVSVVLAGAAAQRLRPPIDERRFSLRRS